MSIDERNELRDLKQQVIDFANEQTNDAFANEMTYEKALTSLYDPAWGLPDDIGELVGRIDEIERNAPEVGVEPSGGEGIYTLGSEDGREYVANVFWSDGEPGYVNFGVFAIESGQMRIIDSGFYNGYETIEDCVRDLAADEVMLKSADIKFVADCSWEISSIEEYREALEEGKLEEPVPVASWNQIIVDGQTMRDTPQHKELIEGIMEKADKTEGRETFYFSFGTSDHFPFKLGWVEVRGAEDRMEACEMYSSHYPKRDGLINCAFVYNEDEWKKSGLGREELGYECHQVITDWGPNVEKNLFDVPTHDGGTERLRVEAGFWSNSKNLIVTIYPNIKEPEYGWDYPMVDMGEDIGRQPLMHAAVAGHADYDIPRFLQESGLAEPTGLFQMGKNSFGEEHLYPVYEFNLDKLMEIDPNMTSRYLEEHGFTVDQAHEYLIAAKEEKPLDQLIKEAREKAHAKNAERAGEPKPPMRPEPER